jgi:hypothetical protein
MPKKVFRVLLPLILVAALAWFFLSRQEAAPPPMNQASPAEKTPNSPINHPPDDATLKQIRDRGDKLSQRLLSLRRRGVADTVLVEAEIYHKAADWITRLNEFYHPDAAAWTLDALDRGLLRSGQISQGETPWLQELGRPVVRAYRSRVDGSVQPYSVTFPADYGADAAKRWRLDVVLHGRDNTLTEVKFLHQHNGEGPAVKDQNFVKLEVYGRGNNGYRWAGETDVSEAIDAFLAVERQLGRLNQLNLTHAVLRGFSMGGAGTWHLGLHAPTRWGVLGPGAGFTTTRGYWKDLPEKLPAYQEDCLHIYDAVDYALNAFNVPIVAYAGAKDPQLQAAQAIGAQLKQWDIPMTLLVAPDLEHQFPPDWQQKAEEEYVKQLAKGRGEYPSRVRFVTYTLRYDQCAWLSLLSLDRHYQRAEVDAVLTEEGYTLQTTNVRALRIELAPGASRRPVNVKLDGQALSVRPYLTTAGTLQLYFLKRGEQWTEVMPERLLTDRHRRPQKIPTQQGPIDDAFMDRFLCVHGTGEPWHPATQKYADEALRRFTAEWEKYLRGDLPVKDDVEVTPEDVATHHLILFGDPSSNSLIAQALDGLPLQWSREKIQFAGHTVPAAEHVPVLICPSPLNVNHYVVLNSGHTFHAADFEGTNARLFPRLGDFALLRLVATKDDPLAIEVVSAGLFDEAWRIPTP